MYACKPAPTTQTEDEWCKNAYCPPQGKNRIQIISLQTYAVAAKIDTNTLCDSPLITPDGQAVVWAEQSTGSRCNVVSQRGLNRTTLAEGVRSIKFIGITGNNVRWKYRKKGGWGRQTAAIP